jgi:hypothetical protein
MLTNLGTSAINWSASSASNWLSVSPAGGTLPAGGFANLFVALNTNAAKLPLGAYLDTLSFSNLTAGTGNTLVNASVSISALNLKLAAATNGAFYLTLKGMPNSIYSVLAATNLTVSPVTWTEILRVTNGLNGTNTFLLPVTNTAGRQGYYRVKQIQ